MKPWRSLRPFGLRWRRLRDWARLLRDDDRPVGWREVWAMIAAVAQAARGEAPPRERLVDNYQICVKCPFHDPEFRRCALCGCFMPYKIATGGRCAAKEQDATSAFGYGA